MSSSTTPTPQRDSGTDETSGTRPPAGGTTGRQGHDAIERARSSRAGVRTALAGLALLAWASATFGSVATAQAAPRPREPRSRPIAATRLDEGRTTMQLQASYELRTDLRYDAARLDVTETVTIVNRASFAIDSLYFSVLARAYGELQLRSVVVDGQPTRAAWPDRACMLVSLPDMLQPDEQITLVIRFSADPKRDAADSLRSRLSKADGMMRVADWYPILSTGHGLRNPGDSQVSAAATSITLDLTTDRALTVAAPGKLIEHDGRHRVYRLDDARNYGFVVAPRLRVLSARTRDGVRVRVFYPAAVTGGRARSALREARRAVETFDDVYGPYPWPELIVAPTPGAWIATEWPSIVFLGVDTYDDAVVVHHEVAHQWFYALMGNDQLQEPWVDEALAHFSERHFFGSRDWSFCSRKRVDSPVYAFPDTFDRWGCGGYVETVYKKGAAMIDGVRARMGDRAFFDATRSLIDDHRFGIATGKDVVDCWLREARRPKELELWLARFLGPRTMRGVA